ncbi:hypothetical protein HQN90_12965 [Paenibacillus alba]|uniref:hypothetical protein n=1 Tax=Paenibacillus alba TaxID=1197127 RepID=UPI001C203F49|nr:hypothetical protein [Paenibacillus alba]NQX67023.1 hypothetical protein [Paenibacillus alba]
MLKKWLQVWVCFVLLFAVVTFTTNSKTSALTGFPTFNYAGSVLNPANLTYNPTGEIIFPAVIKASDHIANPLGTYYLYYAPHDAPGGLSLAYSNSLDGPWTEYSGNPIISNNWSPNYNVSHVSSPYMMWNSMANKYYMYFHGENTMTRIASSTDGIHFTYEKAALNTSNFTSMSLTEISYAKVFEYTIPSKNNKYIMLMMCNNTNNIRNICMALSNDGLNWTAQQTPLITPNSEEGTNLSGPTFFPWNGKYYVAYHATSGNVHITEVGPNFNLQNHLGVMYDSDATIDQGRAASPNFITEGNTMYMFYEQGPRLGGQIAYAKTVLNTQWNIFSDSMSNYAAGWTNSGTGTITQYNNDVNIVDTSTTTYHYITKNNMTPPTGAFTFEVRAKVNAANTLNEITMRSGNYKISLYLTHGTAGTAQNNTSNPSKSYTLDTTTYHNYRVVVQSNYTYDLYVDGILRWSGAASLGTGSNVFKIGGDTATTANISVDQVYLGNGIILP